MKDLLEFRSKLITYLPISGNFRYGIGMEKRKEKDAMGEIEVSQNSYHGAQTERSRQNFQIGLEKMPIEVIYSLALAKKAAAIIHCEMGLLSCDKAEAIVAASEEVMAGKLDAHFPLLVWQTGSGTQTNMNVNEVIANRAIEKMGGVIGSKNPVHPNDDVNRSQSSNDVFPSAMHIASLLMIQKRLLPALEEMKEELAHKVKEFKEVIKIGRTHLMDATPLTLGQEFSAYENQIEQGIEAVKNTLPHLRELALGGTAVGTGLNAPCGFADRTIAKISELTGETFLPAQNKFQALASNDTMVEVSGALKRLAVSFMKIANDIRLLGSGPRSGLAELILPSNEPGSSIMPGKVNPTQAEAMAQVAVQVLGNDAAIGFAGSQGQLELNVYKPVIIYNLIQSLRLLSDVARSFTDKCLKGIKPNPKKIDEHLKRSLMLATKLNTTLGYDKATQIVQKAYREDITLKEASLALGFLSAERFDELVDPKEMVGEGNEVG